MTRRTVLACTVILTALVSAPARAQVPFPRDIVPTRTALARLGLERQWMGVIPLNGDERVLLVSLSNNLFFAQTNKANFHVYDAETGRPLWSAKLGDQTARARPASVNSFAVFVTNLNKLFALDSRTGRPIWQKELGTLPSSSTACDEDLVMVGLNTGKLVGYGLKVKDPKGLESRVSDTPIELWNWQTNALVQTRPLAAGKVVAFGSDDGKVYVAMSEERTLLYRLSTGGAIGTSLGTFGTRLLLVPSADRNLYGVDILTSKILWVFPSGAPLDHEPLVADNDIFVVNTAGTMSSVDPNTGSPHWSTSTQGGRLLAVGAKRVYLESVDGDLFVVDRASGQTVADPAATYSRIGLNIRPYELGVTNPQNDRLYFATSSGLMICLREIGLTRPRPLRDPKALPFGYIPREGISLTPPAAPPAALGPAPAPGEATPPAAGDKPAEPGAAAAPGGEVPAPAPGGEAPK